MKTPGMDRVRGALAALSENGATTVTHRMLFQTLGLEEPAAKDRLRKRMQDLVGRGEATRVDRGEYTYHPDKAPSRTGKSYDRMWRAIRSSKPGWTLRSISLVAHVSYSAALKYATYLEEEGYIERWGQQGNTYKFRATARAREARHTVFPPVASPDPFEKERNAACRLVRQLMERDLGQTAVRRKVCRELKILNERFLKEG